MHGPGLRVQSRVVVRNGMKLIKMAGVAIGGAVCLLLADFVAIRIAVGADAMHWLVLVSELVTIGAVGVVAGSVLRANWYMVAAGPILYFAGMSIVVWHPSCLWVDLHLPLTVITSLTAAFLGASCTRRADGIGGGRES